MKSNNTQDIFIELVKESGLSGKKFREKTNLATSSYSRYKTGKTSIGLEKLYELSKIVNVDIKIKLKKKD